MSVEALELMRTQRAEQIENGPFSEEFSIKGLTATFKGVFDKSHVEDNKDSGNVMQKKLHPRIMVATIPEGLIERSSLIIREKGDEYKFNHAGKDDEGNPELWLY